MAEEVEIRFTGTDAGLTEAANAAANSIEGVDTAAQESSDAMGGASLSFADLAGAVEIAEKAFGALQQAYAATVTPTLEYADQVRELALATGNTAEDASRLIQITGDLGIEFGNLKSALIIAQKNGIEPTIDNIAKLADEYNALAPGVSRTQFIMENFGRSGAALGPLLAQGGAGIRAMAADLEGSSLVLSAAQVEMARQNQIALDNLMQKWEEARTLIAFSVLPGITESTNLATGAISGDIGALIELIGNLGAGFWSLISPIGLLLEPLITLENEFIKVGNALYGLNIPLISLTSNSATATSTVPALSAAMNDEAAAADVAAAATEGVTASIVQLSAASIGQAALGDLNKALSDGTITQEQYDQAFRTIGEDFLGLPAQQVSASLAMSKLGASFTDGKVTIENYVGALQVFADETKSKTEDADTAAGRMAASMQTNAFDQIVAGLGVTESKFGDLRSAIDQIPTSRTVTITVDVVKNDPDGLLDGGALGGEGIAGGGAVVNQSTTNNSLTINAASANQSSVVQGFNMMEVLQ